MKIPSSKHKWDNDMSEEALLPPESDAVGLESGPVAAPSADASSVEARLEGLLRLEQEILAGDIPSPEEQIARTEAKKAAEKKAAAAPLEAAPAPEGEKPSSEGEKPSDEEKPESEKENELSEEERANSLAQMFNMSPEEAKHLDKEILKSRVAKAGKSVEGGPAADDEEAKKRAMAEMLRRGGGGGGGGGGAVKALVDGLSSAVKGTAHVTGTAGGAIGKGALSVVRSRAYSRLNQKLEKSCKTLEAAGPALAEKVGKVNDAFISTDAGAKLAEMANQHGATLDNYLADVHSGKIKSPEALNAMREATQSPQYRDAWRDLEMTMRISEKARDQATNAMEKLNKGFEGKTEVNPERLEKAVDGLQKVEKPTGDPEETKKFMERMEELTKSIQEVVAKFIRSIVSALKR